MMIIEGLLSSVLPDTESLTKRHKERNLKRGQNIK